MHNKAPVSLAFVCVVCLTCSLPLHGGLFPFSQAGPFDDADNGCNKDKDKGNAWFAVALRKEGTFTCVPLRPSDLTLSAPCPSFFDARAAACTRVAQGASAHACIIDVLEPAPAPAPPSCCCPP